MGGRKRPHWGVGWVRPSITEAGGHHQRTHSAASWAESTLNLACASPSGLLWGAGVGEVTSKSSKRTLASEAISWRAGAWRADQSRLASWAAPVATEGGAGPPRPGHLRPSLRGAEAQSEPDPGVAGMDGARALAAPRQPLWLLSCPRWKGRGRGGAGGGRVPRTLEHPEPGRPHPGQWLQSSDSKKGEEEQHDGSDESGARGARPRGSRGPGPSGAARSSSCRCLM